MNTIIFREEPFTQVQILDVLDSIKAKLDEPEIDYKKASALVSGLREELSLYDIYHKIDPGQQMPPPDDLDHVLALVRSLENDLSEKISNRRHALIHLGAVLQIVAGARSRLGC